MAQSAQWFLDVQYWCGLGEVIPFTSYREARQACQELVSQVADMPDWCGGADDVTVDAYYPAVRADGFGFEIAAVELSDEDGYRVSGCGVGGYSSVDDLVDARLVNVLPFVVGKYRIRWLDGHDEFTREAGWPEGVSRRVTTGGGDHVQVC